MERRPLHRSAPGAGRALLEPEDRCGGPGNRGHGGHCARAVWNRDTGMDGRKARIPIRLSAVCWLVGAAAVCTGCSASRPRSYSKKVIVLGIDGMDPAFLERHWPDLPN